jgi:hypothetical protein
MASYTALLKLTQPDLGATGWGTTVNSGVTALVEQAVAGAISVAVTTAGPNTLSAIASGASSDARNQFIVLTGTLSGPATLTVPAAPGATSSKLYFIKNSAGDAVTVTTSGGTSVSVPNGRSMMLKVTTAGVEEAMTHAASLTLGTALAATSGGTGQSSYAVGDLLYAGTTTTLAKLASVATGNVLRAGGVGTAPAWGKVNLTTDVTGILPAANGGTGLSSPGANGNVLRSDGAGNWVSGTLASATTSAEGLVELATDAEVRTGTDTTRAITPDALRKGALVFGTAQSPTSGTTVDFTGVPSWARRIVVIFSAVTLPGTSGSMSMQLGAGTTPETTDYFGCTSYVASGDRGAAAWTSDALLGTGNGADGISFSGVVTLTKFDTSSNSWGIQGGLGDHTGIPIVWSPAGRKDVSGVLGIVRILVSSSFSSGSINILYE